METEIKEFNKTVQYYECEIQKLLNDCQKELNIAINKITFNKTQGTKLFTKLRFHYTMAYPNENMPTIEEFNETIHRCEKTIEGLFNECQYKLKIDIEDLDYRIMKNVNGVGGIAIFELHITSLN